MDEPLGQFGGCRARIDHQNLAGVQQGRSRRADPRPLLDVLRAAFIGGRLYAHGAGRGSAIGAVDQPLGAQGIKIAPNGLRGDVEFVGQRRNPDMGRSPQFFEYAGLPFVLAQFVAHHRASSKHSANSWKP